MKKAITITIPEPCHENWDQMTPTDKGKFCGVCTKEVIDFSKSSDEELIKKVGRGENMCGRFNASQLNRKLTLERRSKNNLLPYAASLLVPLSLLGGPDVNAQGGPNITEKHFTSIGIGSNPVKSIVTITGFISDENNIPVNNAEVFVLETGKSVRTRPDGSYKIVCTSGSTIFSVKGEMTSNHVVLGTKNAEIDLKLIPISRVRSVKSITVGRIISTQNTVKEEEVDKALIEVELEVNEIETEGANIIKELTVDEQLNKGVMGCGLNKEPVQLKGRQKLSIDTDGITVNDTIAKENIRTDITISGTITDEGGYPLPGVNIVIKGTTIGTQTDLDGNYQIHSEANQTLMFTHLGFETKEIVVSNVSNTIGFQMQAMVEGNVSVILAGGISIKEEPLDTPSTNNPFNYKFPRNDHERNERVEKRRKAKANEVAFQKLKLEKKKAAKTAKRIKRKRK